MPRLLVYQGDQVVREVPIEKDPFMIGRALESDLAVMDHLVSRRHAKIIRDGHGGWRIVDLGSANGIFVNEKRVTEAPLRERDRLRIGSASLEYRETGVAAGSSEDSTARTRTLSITLASPGDSEQQSSFASARPVSELRPDYAASPSVTGGGLASLVRERRRAAVSKEGLHFFILYQLAQVVNSATSLEDLFERAIDMLCESLDAGCGAILVLDAQGQLVQRASRDRRRGHGAAAAVAGGGGRGEIRLSQTIVSRVIHERVAILTRDALVDERFRAGQSVAAMQIRSAICVPIWDSDEVEGIIYLDSSHAAGAFSEEDRDLVTAVGHQLAVAIKREEMNVRLKAEAVVRSNLERYHSPDVVDMIIAARGAIELEVREADVTVLFADIEGFTKLSERLAPADVARILNGYFEATTAAIFRHRGQVNKYIGDAILAVFGAPIPNPDHAADACRAALEMQRALDEFRLTLPEPDRFRLRIGVNSGPVVAGNVGAARRLEYTVIGSTVNIASRLEKIAEPGGIAIGPAVEARIRGRFRTRLLGPRRLKGLEKDIEVFELLP